MKKEFNIFRSSKDYKSPLKRHLCIDTDPDNAKEIRDYIYANLDDFLIIAERILTLPKMYYDKFGREFVEGNKVVSAIKFCDKENTRIYCKEMSNKDGDFYIICAETFSKKSQKNNKTNKPILEKISKYEYTHKE